MPNKHSNVEVWGFFPSCVLNFQALRPNQYLVKLSNSVLLEDVFVSLLAALSLSYCMHESMGFVLSCFFVDQVSAFVPVFIVYIVFQLCVCITTLQ